MILAAINLGIFTILFLVLGLIKPSWPLFFVDKPTRFTIIVISTIMVMATGTLWVEGTRRAKLEKEAATPSTRTVAPEPTPVPTPAEPAAVPKSDKPAVK
jgi:hypothetical protein